VFSGLVNQIRSLSHPHVLPIVVLVAPANGKDPIVLTPYRKRDSLFDVLIPVERDRPPDFWGKAAK
jgi:hypothetical protein